MKNYYQTPWLKQDKVHTTNWLKRTFYLLSRPLLSNYASRYVSTETIQAVKPSLVLPGRGMPLETRRLWGAALCHIKEATILVQGTGTGWDVVSWARLKPNKIIATDIVDFKESWAQIATYCKKMLGVDVEFRQSPLEDQSFIADASIDLCVSDAVFEHCLDLKSVLKETFRVLKPGGSLYASYGPLWFSAGGDHFSGRGGLKNVFNHVLLMPEEYIKYFHTFLENNENFQSGGRYVELGLFSKLRTIDYYLLFQKAGFTINSFIIEISPKSLSFKSSYPDLFRKVVENNAGKCNVDDFFISANLVRLSKPIPN